MRKLLLLLPLLLAQPANADFGKEFYEERSNVILDSFVTANDALKSGDINLMCLEYHSGAMGIAAYLPSLQKYFPKAPWVGLRKIARDRFTQYGCSARGFGNL